MGYSQTLGNSPSYIYDAVGNQLSATDRNNRTRRFTYDNLNRQTLEEWLDNSGNAIRTISQSYDAASQILAASDPDSAYSYAYDSDGRLISVDNQGTTGLPRVLLEYAYDSVDNLLSVTDSIDGQTAGVESFTYDALNRMTRITQSGTGVTDKRVDLAYDAASQMTGLTRYADLSGSQLVANSDYIYDEVGRLRGLTHSQGSTVIADYDWRYDAINRITEFNYPDGSSDYSYNARDELTGADHSSQGDESYTYDENGNRTNPGYQTGQNNQLQSDGTYDYTYDGEGNLITRTEVATGETTEYVWDYRNRLIGVTTKDSSGTVVESSEYTYDLLNRRIGKVIDPDGPGSEPAQVERLVYDGDNIILSFDGNGNQTHRYLHGPAIDQVIADEDSSGQVRWGLADNQNTIRDVIDSTGAVLNHIVYNSFGLVTSETNPAEEFRFGYTGRELDPETGLLYYRTRYYDPGTGRFMSEDTIGFAGGDANLYRYVGNSPTNFTDPFGENPLRDMVNWGRRQLGSDPGVYTGVTPWMGRDDSYHEAQRIWAIGAVREHAGLICEVGQHYNVPPEAIAGVILWEAIENPFDASLFPGRGRGPLIFTRPGGWNDFGIIGKIHTQPDSVAARVEHLVSARRPDAFQANITPSIGVNYAHPDLTARQLRIERLLADETVAIEYIGAILDFEAQTFEQSAHEIDKGRDNKLGPYPIRDQAGLLASFYQGVNSEDGAVSFEERRGRFQTSRDPVNDRPHPNLPPEEATMGPWVSQYRWWIRNVLAECGCESPNPPWNIRF